MVARCWGCERVPARGEPREQDAGDHKGNKSRTHPPPTALAPTEIWACVLDDPCGRAGSLSPRSWGAARSGGAGQFSVYVIDWPQALIPNAPPALAPVF